MCGRYDITTPVAALARLFGFEDLPNLEPRYNVAPTQTVPVVGLAKDGRRSLKMLRWGLVPSWAKDLGIGAKLINARAETLAEKPAFRAAYARRRCLVPASGFYEWQASPAGSPGGKVKQPWRIRRRDDAPFAFAGLFEMWKGPPDAPPEHFPARLKLSGGSENAQTLESTRKSSSPTGSVSVRSGLAPAETLATFTIVTTEANQDIAWLHHRMPVILDPNSHATWLSPDAAPGDLAPLLAGAPEGVLDAYAVSTRVNSVKNDDPDLLAPITG